MSVPDKRTIFDIYVFIIIKKKLNFERWSLSLCVCNIDDKVIFLNNMVLHMNICEIEKTNCETLFQR